MSLQNAKGKLFPIQNAILKIPEKNVRENFHYLRLGKHFLGMTPKTQSINEKKLVNWALSSGKFLSFK